jgi:hypothetical protein
MDKLGIVFSGRVRSALLCVLALWILLVLCSSAFRVISSYLAGAGFDANIHDVILIDTLIFLPYYLVAAVMLRSLAARLALFHKLRQQIVVPEYSPPEVLSPAEAGLLVDNDFTFTEIAATLKDLELRGCITIIDKGREMEIHPANDDTASSIERAFLKSLFLRNGFFSTAGAESGTTLLEAGKQMASTTRERLVLGGQLPRNRQLNGAIRTIFTWFACLAFLVQILLTIGVIMATHEIFNVGYPRYAMNVSEPVLELVIIMVVVAIVSSGFWQRSLADDKGLKNWRYVAGLKMFIEKVHKDRFFRDGKQMASDGDMRTFYPYAIALGVEKRFTERLKQALVL